jgi:hypothetical protein
MKKIFLLLSLFLFVVHLYAQTPKVVMEEDYIKPDKRLYVLGDEYVKCYIENGLYIAKPGMLPARLDFGFRFDPYNNPQEKNNAKEASDLEFTIIKVKGSKEAFISVGFNYLYLKFSYNALGQWKWVNYNDDKTYLEGTTQVNADTNKVMLSYRIGSIRCYINGKEIMRYNFEKEQSTQYLRWENAQVFTKDKKMVLALDKVVLKGYPSYTKYPDEIAQDLAKEAVIKEEEAKKILSDNYVLYPSVDWEIKKYGFRDADNKIIIPIKYDDIKYENEFFSEGLAAVKLNGKWGFVNKLGEEVIPLKYDYVHDFKNGFAVVSVGNHPNTLYGLVNITGKEIIAPVNKYSIGTDMIAEGLIPMANSNGLFGFTDTNGVEIIAPKYEQAKRFSDGMAAVKMKGKWGFIDKSGKEVVEAKYDYVDYFSEGFCVVNIGGNDEGTYADGGKYGYIDKTGKQITELKYYWAHPFSEGLALVVEKEEGVYEFIDPTGKTVLSLSKYTVVRSFSDGLTVVRLDVIVPSEDFPITKSGCIDKTGKEIIPLTTDFLIWHEYFSEGLIADANDDMSIGFIDKTGKVVIPYQYKSVAPFKNGRAEVKKGDKVFYIDKTGKQL